MGIYPGTSAIAKLYRPEIGTPVVEQLVNSSPGDCFIARIGVLEMLSALAQKVRMGELSPADSALVLQGLRGDIRKRRFRVVALSVRHYERAEILVGIHGPRDGLRALDALHLAVAVDLKEGGLVTSMIVADKVLCRVALFEGLPAIDPEAGVPRAAA